MRAGKCPQGSWRCGGDLGLLLPLWGEVLGRVLAVPPGVRAGTALLVRAVDLDPSPVTLFGDGKIEAKPVLHTGFRVLYVVRTCNVI